MRIKAAIILLSFVFLAGCATTPISYSDATPVPKSNLLEGYGKFAKANPGYSRVVVVRDSGFQGGGVPAILNIEGAPIAKFWTSESVELFLSPDTYIFGLEAGGVGWGLPYVETTFEIKPNKTYWLRISSGVNGFSLQQSTQIK